MGPAEKRMVHLMVEGRSLGMDIRNTRIQYQQ